jgi:hypothetical protein
MGQQSLQGFDLAPSAGPHCLHDTRLEPTHSARALPPVDGVPSLRSVGSRTSSCGCRHLLCLLSQFALLSRAERPEGSLPAFAGDGGMPAPSLSALLPSGVRLLPPPLPAVLSACLTGCLPRGKNDGLTVFHSGDMNGVGAACSPVAVLSAYPESAAEYPSHIPFGSSLSAALACHT